MKKNSGSKKAPKSIGFSMESSFPEVNNSPQSEGDFFASMSTAAYMPGSRADGPQTISSAASILSKLGMKLLELVVSI